MKHFGTDGIRGVVGVGITPDYVVRVAKATADYLLQETPDRHPLVVVGCDTRRSCDSILNILAGVLSGYGVDVVNIGTVPSTGLSFVTNKMKAELGIMVSASHNSCKYNGLKYFAPSGEKLCGKETARIDKMITQKSAPAECSKADGIGKIENRPDCIRLWEKHIIKKFKPLFGDIKGKKNTPEVHVDCAFGSGGEVACRVLRELGFKVVPHNVESDGFNINLNSGAIYPLYLRRVFENSENGGENTPSGASGQARKHAGNRVGFALDGDADRCVVVDFDGEIVHGDVLLFTIAKFLQSRGEFAKNTLVSTVMFNLGAERSLEKKGIKLLRTPVGDSYVYAAIKKHGLVFGGETSGHLIFTDVWCCGDGLVTALMTLLAIQNTGAIAHQECEIYPQVTKNLTVTAEKKTAFETDKPLKDYIEHLKKTNPDNRIIVRPSGTEDLIRITVEGAEVSGCERLVNNICERVQGL